MSVQTSELLARPQWAARVYAPKVGRDHLGLGSVSSDQILPSLVPGINVLTIHPRYHSFYIFLLDEFWRSERPRTYNEWKNFYRPREFLFSAACYLCDQPEHGDLRTVVGGQKSGSWAIQSQTTFDTTFHYIDSDLGGYGLYYRSVSIEMGLVYPGGPGLPTPIDLPSEKGKRLAANFRLAVQNTSYYRQYFAHDATHVPKDVALEYIRNSCLCQLKREEAQDHTIVLETFCHGGVTESAEARRKTLCLFLDMADKTQGFPIGADTFRQLLYFGAASSGAKYRPHPNVIETYPRWRLYQAREYYAFALNALWVHLCDLGLELQGDLRPIQLQVLHEHFENALDFTALARLYGVQPPSTTAKSDFSSLLHWLERIIGATGEDFDEYCTLDKPVHEHRLYQSAMDMRSNVVVMVAGMVTLLALLFLRFGNPAQRNAPEWEISKMGADGRLSVDGFLHSVRRRLQGGGFTTGDFVQWLLNDYIILQHQLIATSKLPENTFRFQREGDQLRFFRLDNGLGFLDSRFEAISTTVHELGLCGDLRLPEHPLTQTGHHLLSTGEQP